MRDRTAIGEESVGELPACIAPKAGFWSEGLRSVVKKALAERMPNAEAGQHLEAEPVRTRPYSSGLRRPHGLLLHTVRVGQAIRS